MNECKDTGAPPAGQAERILASGSPRRRDLLAAAGLRFRVAPPTIEEPDEAFEKLAPPFQAEALAYFKARSVAREHPQAYVLGADTICSHEGRVIGKPREADHAREILRGLAGSRHAVITGVALLGPGDTRLISYDETYVTMKPMTREQIEAYIASGEWRGKAGAYAIQETADQYVERLEGSFDTVVGLPVTLVRKMLEELMAHPEAHKLL